MIKIVKFSSLQKHIVCIGLFGFYGIIWEGMGQKSSGTPCTVLAKESVRYKIPQIMLNVPNCITDKIDTHSLDGFTRYAKNNLITNYYSYCQDENCYVCNL